MGDREKKYVHMLNATLCATGRAICCLLETYQEKDGVRVPDVLVPYMGGMTFMPFVRDSKIPDKQQQQPQQQQQQGAAGAKKEEKKKDSKPAEKKDAPAAAAAPAVAPTAAPAAAAAPATSTPPKEKATPQEANAPTTAEVPPAVPKAAPVDPSKVSAYTQYPSLLQYVHHSLLISRFFLTMYSMHMLPCM